MSYNNIISPDMLTEGEENTEETVMYEESEVNQNININIKKESGLDISYEENIAYEDEKTVDSTKNNESVFIGIKQEWAAETASKPLGSIDSEDERTEFYIEKTEGEEEEDDEEETIAMFVTASGQQLALYAVEDSDDYFAVAVYDESGEPPSNFQFLMKSDVERLIREGAVRTVKKPTQIKRQLVTTQPPVFIPKEEITGDIIKTENRTELIKNRNFDNKKKVTTHIVKSEFENPPPPKIIRLDDSGSEEELVEQSTVQYILCDGDQSDTELTFDEIQATLQGLKTKTNNLKKHKNISIEKPPPQKKTNNGLVYIATPPSICNTSYRGAFYQNSMKIESPPKQQSPVKRSHLSNTSIIGSKQNHGIKRELSPMTDYYTPNTSVNISLSDSLTNTNSQSKVKRPRKQQLTSVNREDTEIIIQPASMLEEEEEIPMPRKRGKRKKKNANKISKLPTRKSTRRRRTRVEIIDIDIDDSDSDETLRRKEVLEITLDENKEKGSSDKENEIIMVGDSDDEDDEDDEDIDEDNDEDDDDDDDYDDSMKCRHCSKVFKHRRAFDSHTRVCTKFRGRSHRLSDRYSRDESSSENESPRNKKINKKNSKDKSSKPKKEYTCKTCEEKFDMVVTLARHVRAEHTPRKRGRPSKADTKKLQMQIEINRLKNLERKNAELEKDDDDDDDESEKESEEEIISKKQEESEKNQPPEEEEEEEEVAAVAAEEETEEKEENSPRNNESAEQNLESKKSLNIVNQSKMVKLANKRKLIARLHRKWKFADLSCTICNRWLPSASAHENHILQHFTKRRIARDIYECSICHKFFKSQFTYMKHKKLHTKVERNFKSEESEKFMKDRELAIRRCGRPQKLQANI
ncbi:glutamic acid-rich protein-like [Leptopilina boulardi]|uniref:glutamic acid-rich protein-like n=1 Tax=Leptopilina boulardi TaxID=63433 RepID=UPI0021F5739E|nr:glutamic acid-rich protein-like [Leptopilina boulardi]